MPVNSSADTYAFDVNSSNKEEEVVYIKNDDSSSSSQQPSSSVVPNTVSLDCFDGRICYNIIIQLFLRILITRSFIIETRFNKNY